MFVAHLPWAEPVALAARLSRRAQCAWLDASGETEAARYAFLAAEPVETRRLAFGEGDPFEWLGELEQAAAPETPSTASELPAARVPQWIGYLAYDAHFCGRAHRHARTGTPVACFARYDAVLVFDRLDKQLWIAGDDADACARLRAHLAADDTRAERPALRVGRVSSGDPARHAAAIERALVHIARGDIYQVNLAREFRAEVQGDAFALAIAMRNQSPVPLGVYFDDGQRKLIARTMECFLRWDRASRRLVTRPIKGTLARTGDDAGEARRLAADPKERAEHVMIIDLMRNDLSRLAEAGSVRVSQIMTVERYAKLSHLVSTVECVTRAEVGLRELAEATFPPGSVTGTPKLRAIEIIEALEQTPRGIYTGAVGYVDRAGGLSLAVAIRTAVVDAGVARYFAGGGIVEASDVARELAETELKARVFLDALQANDSVGLSGVPTVG